MKAIVTLLLVALLAGCSASGNDAARIASLQKRVSALSAQIDRIEGAKAVLANFELQRECRAAADAHIRDDHHPWDFTGGNKVLRTSTNFNRTRDECFLLISELSPADGTQTFLLREPQNLTYGVYWASAKGDVINCYYFTRNTVAVSCKSELQFDAGAAHYMGEHYMAENVPKGVQQRPTR